MPRETKINPNWRRGRAEIIEGEVIGPRFGKALSIAGAGLSFMVLATLGFYWAIDFSFKKINPVMARWLGYMGAAAVVVLIGIGITLYLLVRLRRLIIGKNRLQLIGSFGR